MEKAKNLAVVAVFFAFLFGFSFAFAVLPDRDVSFSERRKLAQRPDLSTETVLDGSFMDDLEDYLLDQFPQRDFWRSVRAATRFYLFFQMDNNGIYLVNDSIYKLEYPLKDDQVRAAANKIAEVCGMYLSGMRVYWSVVPDKNYYTAEQTGRPALDYDRLLELVKEGVPEEMMYVDLFGELSADDYFRTDPHWRQDRIVKAAKKLAKAMGNDFALREEDFVRRELFPFSGAYLGQSALSVAPDILAYLESPYTESARVTSADRPNELLPVYTVEKFSGMDGYDVFLDGAASVLTVTCENAPNGKELIIFRDSNASSLAPLLLGTYSKITLVDLRYIRADMVGDYVDFHNQDVLFLYGVPVLNSGGILR